MNTADFTVSTRVRMADTRIAAYQLVEYLERVGVEFIFGLCGHTVIAFLHALEGSSIRYISTRHEQVAATPIPEAFDYLAVSQLRAEAKQKLTRVRPRNLGQAGRISGITPADIAVLMLYIREPDRLAS